MNTFSWVICKCQSGNGAERRGWGERERSQKKTVATTGCFVLPEPRNQKAQARPWARAEEKEGRGGTVEEEAGTQRKRGQEWRGQGWREMGEGELRMEKKLNQEKQFK